MANDLVVQLGAKLDQFASDLNQAGDMADSAISRIESKFASLNPGLGSLGSAAFAGGAMLGLQQIVGWIENANKSLADMQTTAKQVGLSLSDFQSLKFAGNVSGLSDDKFTQGLQSSAALLNDAQRNANSLTKLFDANGNSVKNTNGQLITENQLLNQVAKYMSDAATEQDKIKIAEMVGLTRDWVPFLEKGADAFRSIADEAASVGVIIDDSTIQKATEFDTAWRKSSVEWSTYMHAALASLLPVLDDLLEKSANLVPSRTQVKQAQNDTMKALGEAGVPEEGGLQIGVTPETSQALKDFKDATNLWDGIVSAIRALKGSIQIIDPNDVPGYAASKVIEPSYPTEAQMNAAFKKQYADADAAQDAEQDKGDASTKIPGRGSNANDAYDRATNSVVKYTAKVQAETDALGLGAAATEEAKAQAQLLTAAQQAGIPITDKVKDQMQDLAQDAGDAADALAKAKVASEISRGTQTAFLTPADLAIANQLKGIYGDDITAALNSAEAAALRFNRPIGKNHEVNGDTL